MGVVGIEVTLEEEENNKEDQTMLTEGEIMRMIGDEDTRECLGTLSRLAGGRRWDDDVHKMTDALNDDGDSGSVYKLRDQEAANICEIEAAAAIWNLLPGWCVDFTVNDPDDNMPLQ